MVEQSLYFNSTFADRRRYGAADIAKYWRSFIKSGLVHVDGEPTLRVLANGENMTVNLEDGKAILFGHLYIKHGVLAFNLSPSAAIEDRFDRIVLRLDNKRSDDDSRFIRAFLKEGTALGPPELERTFVEDTPIIYEVSLAQIHVKAGKSFLEQSDIIDERLDEQLCGLASSLVTVPTDIFTEEWKEFVAEYNRWFAKLQGSAYATVDDVRASENNMKREIANLNLHIEANKRVKNGATFGTNFADNFGMEIDMARTSSDAALIIGTTVINVRDTTDFKVNTEVTIFDDVNLERVGITSISGNAITLAKALAKPYKEGVNIARSMIIQNVVSNYASFGAWGTYEKRNHNKTSLTPVTGGSIETVMLQNFVRAGDSWYKIRENTGAKHLDRLQDGTGQWVSTGVLFTSIKDSIRLETDGKYVFCSSFPLSHVIRTTVLLDGVIKDTADETLNSTISYPNLSNRFNVSERKLHIFTSVTRSQNNNEMLCFCYGIGSNGALTKFGNTITFKTTTPGGGTYNMIQNTPTLKNVDMIFEADRDLFALGLFEHYAVNKKDFDVYSINKEHTSVVQLSTMGVSYYSPDLTFFKYDGKYYVACGGSGIDSSSKGFIAESNDLISWTRKEFLQKSISSTFYDIKGNVYFSSTGGAVKFSKMHVSDAIDVPFYDLGTSTGKKGIYFPTDGSITRPFTISNNATLLDGEGTIGYGNDITLNDMRFKVKPTKEMVVWLKHSAGLVVDGVYAGNIHAEVTVADNETQAVGVSTQAFDEVRVTISRQTVDEDVKITRILGGVD